MTIPTQEETLAIARECGDTIIGDYITLGTSELHAFALRILEEFGGGRDAERYRWLRNEANFARKSDPMVCLYPLDNQELIDGERLDQAIDAAIAAEKGQSK